MASINNRSLEMMENTFSDYLMKKISKESLEKRLSTILSNTPFDGGTKKFEISIVNRDRKEEFFGMRIFPVIDKLDNIAKGLVVEKHSFKDICNQWKKIDTWYIEIDDYLFDRISINFTPHELVSLLLHEIGHVIYSEKPIEVFYRAYQEAYMRMKIAEKASLKVLYSLYTIPLASSCMIRSWSKNNVKEEYFADSTLHKMGYSKHLQSALEKIIKAYGNSIQPSTDVSENLIKSSIKWCNINIVDLTKRQKRLKDDLFYQTIKNDSGYMKALSFKILNKLGLELRENYTGAVVESSVELICAEGFVFDYTSTFNNRVIGNYEKMILSAQESAKMELALEARRNKIVVPSRYDIDAIFVEVDRITNHHDRIYVLDLIYNQLEEIERFKELMENDKELKRKHSNKIEPMVRDLEELRKAVLAKRSFKTNYKLFIKVPDGYEG